jgi:DoxX-like family
MTDACTGPVTIAVSTGVQISRCHPYGVIADDCDESSAIWPANMSRTVNMPAGGNLMSAATIVASLALTVLLAAASAPKLLDPVSARKNAERLGVSTGLYLYIVGACQGLAVVGLIVGLFWWPLEIVAASGVGLLMIAVVGDHRRAGEPMSKALPASLGLVLAAFVIGGQVVMLAR